MEQICFRDQGRKISAKPCRKQGIGTTCHAREPAAQNPKPGTLGEQQVEASPGDPRATIWQGREYSKKSMN